MPECVLCGDSNPYAGFRPGSRRCRGCEAIAAQRRRGPRQRFNAAEARELERLLRRIIVPVERKSDCRCGECEALRGRKLAAKALAIMKR